MKAYNRLLPGYNFKQSASLYEGEKRVMLGLVEQAVTLLNSPQVAWTALSDYSALTDEIEESIVLPFIRETNSSPRKARNNARLLLEWTRQTGLNSYLENAPIGALADGTHLFDCDKLGLSFGVRFVERVILAQHRQGTALDPYVSPFSGTQALLLNRTKKAPEMHRRVPNDRRCHHWKLPQRLQCLFISVNERAFDALVWLMILLVMTALMCRGE